MKNSFILRIFTFNNYYNFFVIACNKEKRNCCTDPRAVNYDSDAVRSMYFHDSTLIQNVDINDI